MSKDIFYIRNILTSNRWNSGSAQVFQSREKFSKGISAVKLTLRATRTEPAGVAVAVLGRRGRATIVDARALNTAIRIVQAFLLELAPRAVIKTLASAPLAQVMSMTATILPIILLLTNLSAVRLHV